MKTALLVIDDDTPRAEELCLLLRFMEEAHVMKAESSNWREQAEYNSELRAIFLGRYGVNEQLIEAAIQAIHTAAPRAAIILVEEINQHRPLPTAIDNLCTARLSHPFRYPRLSLVLAKLMQQRANHDTRNPQSQRHTELFRSLIGKSTAIAQVRELIQRVAPSEATVLILGESGTGKEVVARNIHYFSARSQGPFVPINCGAIPDNLLESELFGHEKGAFTGANQLRQGRFEQANHGTLFLDEIGDMPLDTQTRLLRVLADGEFYRVGGHVPVKVDVRIIAATHQNLERLVAEGKFREDLYHRLNVIRVHIPRLRDRREDIPMLAQHFLARAAKELSVEPKVLKLETASFLQQLPWPGNVRQLENTCRWLTVMASGREIVPTDLPPELQHITSHEVVRNAQTWEQALSEWARKELASGTKLLLEQALPTFERVMITAALNQTGGRRRDAAEVLGWGRNTLTRKIKELKMEVAGEEDEE